MPHINGLDKDQLPETFALLFLGDTPQISHDAINQPLHHAVSILARGYLTTRGIAPMAFSQMSVDEAMARIIDDARRWIENEFPEAWGIAQDFAMRMTEQTGRTYFREMVEELASIDAAMCEMLQDNALLESFFRNVIEITFESLFDSKNSLNFQSLQRV